MKTYEELKEDPVTNRLRAQLEAAERATFEGRVEVMVKTLDVCLQERVATDQWSGKINIFGESFQRDMIEEVVRRYRAKGWRCKWDGYYHSPGFYFRPPRRWPAWVGWFFELVGPAVFPREDA